MDMKHFSSNSHFLALLEDWCAHLLCKFQLTDIPVDLNRLARHLGVAEVVERPMVAWGSVGKVDGKIVVELRKGTHLSRQRFSFAHELGHLILDQLKGNSADASFRRYRSQIAISVGDVEEHLADHIAGCLLLPARHLRPFLGDRLDLFAIQRAALAAQASLSAALFRTVALATQPCVVFLLRAVGERAPRVLWHRCSSSVSYQRAFEDLSSTCVLETLLQHGQAEALDLQYNWLDCQSISKKTADGVTDYWCLSTVIDRRAVKTRAVRAARTF